MKKINQLSFSTVAASLFFFGISAYAANTKITAYQLCYTHWGSPYQVPLEQQKLFVGVNQENFFVRTDQHGVFKVKSPSGPSAIRAYLTADDGSILPGCFSDIMPIALGTITVRGIDCPVKTCQRKMKD